MSILRLAFVVAVVGSGCSKAATGSESGACYGNNTCNAGLVCLSNVCVNPGSDAAVAPVSMDGGSADLSNGQSMDMAVRDAAAYNDVGLPCPGAEIWHPGTEARKVGTSVPFIGHAQNATCMPIVGPDLVWIDNLEGQIGTGETFTYTFTIVGTHTVTLTAMDGANNYYAYVTFPIIP
jgi:hypothetical protein